MTHFKRRKPRKTTLELQIPNPLYGAVPCIRRAKMYGLSPRTLLFCDEFMDENNFGKVRSMTSEEEIYSYFQKLFKKDRNYAGNFQLLSYLKEAMENIYISKYGYYGKKNIKLFNVCNDYISQIMRDLRGCHLTELIQPTMEKLAIEELGKEAVESDEYVTMHLLISIIEHNYN